MADIDPKRAVKNIKEFSPCGEYKKTFAFFALLRLTQDRLCGELFVFIERPLLVVGSGRVRSSFG